MDGAYSTHREMRIAYIILARKPEGIWTVDWISVAQDRVQWWDLLNILRNLRIP
jgi:hypothetical protein